MQGNDAAELLDYYTRLRPAAEYDGRSPARWLAVSIDEYTDETTVIELQLMIGVRLSDRCFFHYVKKYSIEDVPCQVKPISDRATRVESPRYQHSAAQLAGYQRRAQRKKA